MKKIFSQGLLLGILFLMISEFAGAQFRVRNDKKIGAQFLLYQNARLTLFNKSTEEKLFKSSFMPAIAVSGEFISSNNLVFDGRLVYFQQEFEFKIDDDQVFVNTTGYSLQVGMKFYYDDFTKKNFVPYGGIYLATFSSSHNTFSKEKNLDGKSANTSNSILFINAGMDYHFRTATFRFGIDVAPYSGTSSGQKLINNFTIHSNYSSPVIVFGVTSSFS